MAGESWASCAARCWRCIRAARSAKRCCINWRSDRCAIQSRAPRGGWRWRRWARLRRKQGGKVWLVGAGPGDPDLLTVKALRLIQSAHVILHDDLVPRAILDLGRDAEVVNVGKRCGVKNITQEEINALMIEHARNGRRVVRLKSGDPLIFGRAAEEMAALTRPGLGSKWFRASRRRWPRRRQFPALSPTATALRT